MTDTGETVTEFPAFSPADWQELTAYLRTENCQVGATLFAEGDASDGLYFLLGGKFAVQKKGGLPGKVQTVALLSAGSVAGEGALAGIVDYDGVQPKKSPLPGAGEDDSMAGISRRHATLVCLEAGGVLFLSQEAHARLCQDNPRLCLTLCHYLLRISSLRLGCASDRLAVLL